MNKKHIVAVIQQEIVQRSDDNLIKSAALIEEACFGGAKLVILPELHNHRYFCQSHSVENFKLAEPIPGPTTQFFSEIAQKHAVVLVISVFERSQSEVYFNTAVVIETDGSIAGIYRKMHIPDDPGFHEKYYFTPGNKGFIPINTSVGRLGVMVCWDQWFPEAARLMALQGAEMLIYPTAIGWDPSDTKAEKARQQKAWQTIQISHAIANHIPVLVSNRVGFEPHPVDLSKGIEFWGNSFICGGLGELLIQAQQESNMVLSIDLAQSKHKQDKLIWPFLRDRRATDYQYICTQSQ